MTAHRYDRPPMNPDPSPSDAGLTERLRLGTRELHLAAERCGLMAALLGGRIQRGAYLQLLRNLHALYAVLETALARRQAEPAWEVLADPVLHRTAALAADLLHLHGPGWPEDLPLTDAAAAYADRLQQLADEASPALAAHAYVRYLGDLHGGQVLRRRVGLALGLAGDTGLAFYAFGPDEGLPALRAALRQALGSLPLSAAQQQAVVDEARWGFKQHIRLFDELAAQPA